MAKKKEVGDWCASINGKTTFAGIIVDFYDEMCKDNFWRAERTKENYYADYGRRIIPYIDDHDSLPLECYTKTHYLDMVTAIRESGQYKEERILHFMRLMAAVDEMANKMYGYPRILQGTAFELPPEIDVNEKIKELVVLKRSLSPKQELDLYNKLMSDCSMSGERFGVLLMFACGVRNGEAAAITFGDLMESYIEDGFHVLFVYKTIESKKHHLVSSGKTSNADRIIPVVDDVYDYLIQRKQYLAEQTGKTMEELNEYPIACVGKEYDRNCIPDQIAQAAKVLFFEIGLKPKVLSYMDYEILKGEDSVVVKEKDPTSYMMRRNFATQMDIIGMSESEIQFLLGHDITDSYETRNEMVNFDALKRMGERMNERGIYYKKVKSIHFSDLEYEKEEVIDDFSAVNINMNLKKGDSLYLRISSEEPKGTVSMKFQPESGCQIEKKEFRKKPEYKDNRTINILNDYHKTYMINKKVRK